MHLRGQKPGRRSHLLLQRSAEDEAALSALERHALAAANLSRDRERMAGEIADPTKRPRVLITGICGFVGSALAPELKRQIDGLEVRGLDNLTHPGSEQNCHVLTTNC